MTEDELWAASGAMALTGRASGPPLPCAGAPATAIQASIDALRALGVVGLPDVRLLGERAAITGRTRAAPFSVGGSFQIMPSLDSWFGLSLSRPSDVALLPALLEREVGDDPWDAVAGWLETRRVDEALERALLLGLPAAIVASEPPVLARAGVLVSSGGSRTLRDRPLVVDLSSLWAGPLCAHVLGLSGARVIKVESISRPDAARSATPEFFDLLHGDHESVAIDFDRDRPLLHALIDAADVVVEASRPRALQQLGISAGEQVARGTVWVSITAYGRDGAAGLRVGFGDDIAADAGLIAWEGGVPYPAGDALADPLAGMSAAAAAVAALEAPRGALIDVSMNHLAAAAARQPAPRCAAPAAAMPTRREAPSRAARFGAQTNLVRREFMG